ncbi:NUDIX hydrolase [Peribacillus glennii]|uniref:NUDIX domain-containing protein n=1 Tax=Peribacillus glennii TaxID=2303991 RepID=A0A372LJH9_9BACI|nr:NUDIX domain-containing protein [Peribacillus glennii]RFU66644.1 NUDIX domain-containing protein [Peribacillus glennii]
MGTEIPDIYDSEMNHRDVCERGEVHQKGYWHKSFHCWFYQIENGAVFLLFQKRDWRKYIFPGLLDITAAGHLEAGERPEQGIREIHEEVGLYLAAVRAGP